MKKVGVIPFQIIDGNITVLMVTSIRTQRWILPKGNLKSNESHKKGCLREAFEEAGIDGKILKDFPMTMVMPDKAEANGEMPVVFYPMLVKNQAETWPEQDRRQRKWMGLDAALAEIPSKDVLNVLHHFKTLSPWVIKATEAKS